MGNLMSVINENPEPRRRPSSLSIRPRSAADDSDAAYFNEQPHRRPRPSEVPPTGVLTEVLGEMTFYYGACWLYYRLARRWRSSSS